MLARVDIAGVAIPAVLGLIAIYLGWRQMRLSGQNAELQYVVTTTTKLVPEGWGTSLQVVHGEEIVNDPWLTITRIVHTGQRAITVEDFNSPLRLKFIGSMGVASVNQTGQRPTDLEPLLERDADSVLVSPTLINPGDMVEIQAVTTGQPSKVELSGRLSEVTYTQLPRLPYPPGGGPEGELLGLDKIITFGLPVGMSLILAAAFALDSESSLATRIAVPIGSVIVGCCLWPWYESSLIKRRALFKPERKAGTPESTRTA